MKLFMKYLKNAVKCTVVLGVLCTVIYPAALTLAGQALFPKQANGSMVMAVIDGEERAVGSKYVGQQFEDSRFFHGRISSVITAIHRRKRRTAAMAVSHPVHLTMVIPILI